jgi:4-carboxymuconolactone decarboxylase
VLCQDGINVERKEADMKIVQTAGRNQLGEFAPDFAEFNDDVLFGRVWSD